MSVATKNPFALLDDDSPQDFAPKKEEAPAPAAAAAKGAAKTRGGGPASRGGKYYQRGGKPQSGAPAEEPAGENQRKTEGARDARGRGGRGGRGGAGRGGRGRPFDKHSQTGKTDSDKKIHQSWGGDDGNTELKAETAATFDAAAETSNDWGAPAAADDAWGAPADTTADAWGPSTDAAPAAEGGEGRPERGPRREREPEEEDNTLTLDQYLAQQKEKDSALPKLEGTRKANDGADDAWKDAVVLEKNEEEETYFAGKTKNAPKARAKKEDKVYLEIEARFDRPDRGGRGRGRGGDRGGDRGGRGGGRGRGAPRGGRQSNGNTTLNVDDQTAFPSLS